MNIHAAISSSVNDEWDDDKSSYHEDHNDSELSDDYDLDNENHDEDIDYESEIHPDLFMEPKMEVADYKFEPQLDSDTTPDINPFDDYEEAFHPDIPISKNLKPESLASITDMLKHTYDPGHPESKNFIDEALHHAFSPDASYSEPSELYDVPPIAVDDDLKPSFYPEDPDISSEEPILFSAVLDNIDNSRPFSILNHGLHSSKRLFGLPLLPRRLEKEDFGFKSSQGSLFEEDYMEGEDSISDSAESKPSLFRNSNRFRTHSTAEDEDRKVEIPPHGLPEAEGHEFSTDESGQTEGYLRKITPSLDRQAAISSYGLRKVDHYGYSKNSRRDSTKGRNSVIPFYGLTKADTYGLIDEQDRQSTIPLHGLPDSDYREPDINLRRRILSGEKTAIPAHGLPEVDDHRFGTNLIRDSIISRHSVIPPHGLFEADTHELGMNDKQESTRDRQTVISSDGLPEIDRNYFGINSRRDAARGRDTAISPDGLPEVDHHQFGIHSNQDSIRGKQRVIPPHGLPEVDGDASSRPAAGTLDKYFRKSLRGGQQWTVIPPHRPHGPTQSGTRRQNPLAAFARDFDFLDHFSTRGTSHSRGSW